MQYYFAPVQGNTDAAYRHFHASNFPGEIIYMTPFIRLENSGLRPKDIKDLTCPLNGNHNLIPQIIFRDEAELRALVDRIKDLGFTRINLNMGCPFPLQTGHGRGAATVANEDLAHKITEVVKNNPDIKFSVKMRLGMENPKEWQKLIERLNDITLDFIAVHPRVAKQQYSGELYLDEFENILKTSKNPVIFNGDITTPLEAKEIIDRFPKIEGIMIGRGAIARPTIFSEIEKEEIEPDIRLASTKRFHRELLHHYEDILCGDAQILSKISPFWEYSEKEIGRKAWKEISKAKTLPKYKTAISKL